MTDGQLHFQPGSAYALINDRAQLDLLVVEKPVHEILQHTANAGSVRVDNPAGLDLDHRMTMNLKSIPSRRC